MAANTLVECNIPFNHLPKKLIDIVNKFTEQLVKVELKEVEVSGWEELTSEIPMDEEVVERWGSPPRREGDLDLDDVLYTNVEPFSKPVRRVKVRLCKLSCFLDHFLLDIPFIFLLFVCQNETLPGQAKRYKGSLLLSVDNIITKCFSPDNFHHKINFITRHLRLHLLI